MAPRLVNREAVAAEGSPARWLVEFARFFRFPCSSSSSIPPSVLCPPKTKNTKSDGTWIPSSSLAVLALGPSSIDSLAVLSVSISDVIYQEHSILNLLFSWPQVSCVSECPARGSRAVFVSFRDSSDQIQKFAVRFSSCNDAEAFINSVKVSRVPENQLVSVNPFSSEHVVLDELQCRIEHESSFEEPIQAYIPQLPGLAYDKPPGEVSSQTICVNDMDAILSSCPSSYIEMLTHDNSNSSRISTEQTNTKCSEILGDRPSLREGCNLEFTSKESVYVEQPKRPIDDERLVSLILECMSDTSFHDMLGKIERVIHELSHDFNH